VNIGRWGVEVEIVVVGVFGGDVGVDLPKVNPNLRIITCPYTGKKQRPLHGP